MHVDKVITADGDFFVIYDELDEFTVWYKKVTRRMDLQDIIQEITDSAKLPEYLTDEDLDVVEAAKSRLEELTGEQE